MHSFQALNLSPKPSLRLRVPARRAAAPGRSLADRRLTDLSGKNDQAAQSDGNIYLVFVQTPLVFGGIRQRNCSIGSVCVCFCSA